MKILFHHRILSRDGQSVHLDEMVNALRSAGNDVLVVGPRVFAKASFGYDPKSLNLLKRLVPKTVYEILELAYNVPAYFRLLRATNAFKPDLLYERYNLNLVAGVWLKRRKGIKMFLEVNAPLARERASYGGIGLSRLACGLERFIWRGADRVLPVSKVLADEIRHAGVPTERISVVPNAINPARFQSELGTAAAKSELGLNGKTVIGFVGFVRAWHGLDAIIDWLGQEDSPPDLHLVVAGEGPALPSLKTRARELRVEDRVHFVGLVRRDTVARVISAFDIALVPKCLEYASPLKLFEYMALGKAIVAPDQPNIREVVKANVSALLFDAQRPGSLLAAIRRLHDDPELRTRLGLQAQRLVDSKRLTWNENAARVTSLAQLRLSAS